MNVLNTLEQLQKDGYTIGIVYEYNYCTVYIDRYANGTIGVQAFGFAQDDCLERAYSLLRIYDTHKIVPPDVSEFIELQNKQIPWYDDKFLNLKRYRGKLYITRIYSMDKFGFESLDAYIDLTKHKGQLEKITSQEQLHTYGVDEDFVELTANLKDQEELWWFDNIQSLSGHAALLVVKNGIVIKRKVKWMS